MNVRYLIKNCKGFGYAMSIGDCKLKQITRNKDKQIVYIKDSKNENRIKNAINVGDEDLTFDNFCEEIKDAEYSDERFDKETIFFVEVGVKDTEIRKHDVEINQEELERIIDEFDIDADISDENKEAYKGFTKLLIQNPKQYVNAECTESYLDFLSHLYPKINDSKLQRSILQLLVYNQKRCDDLVREHPISFEPVEEEITRLSTVFSDMQIADPYFEKTEEFNVEQINGVSRNLTTGNLLKFGGFSNKFAQVEHAKKRANIPEINRLRNHQVIDMLVRNRIASVPHTFAELNISKLMKTLARFRNFHLILIYPNYHQPFVYCEYPNKSMEIDVEGGNVVMAVFLRYILINFYGMHAVVNEEDRFTKYLM